MKSTHDFVPDDFPHLKMEIKEIRSIYRKMADAKALGVNDISKVNMAIDRVLRQYKINKAKEDSVAQRKLISQQLLEEEKAKKLALREERDLARKKRQEEARARIELRRIAAEQEAELARMKEQARILEEQKKQEEAKREEIDRIMAEERRKLEDGIRESQEFIKKTQADIDEKEKQLKSMREDYAANKARLEAQKKALEESKQRRMESIAKLQQENEATEQKAQAHKRQLVKQEEELQILKYMQERVLMQIQETTLAYWQSERALSARIKFDQDLEKLTMVDKMEFAPVVASTAQKKKQLELYKRLLEKSIATTHIDTVEEVLAAMGRNCSEEDLDREIQRVWTEFKKRTKSIKIKKGNKNVKRGK